MNVIKKIYFEYYIIILSNVFFIVHYQQTIIINMKYHMGTNGFKEDYPKEFQLNIFVQITLERNIQSARLVKQSVLNGNRKYMFTAYYNSFDIQKSQ